ncbi:AgrD family cyclic lactone autoinducer peptide [Calderihabitans maritimus]|uniref:Cyclic lactone autoinducer peptide n=1 Tax=Calderihabitans maritimus TaxID=1246530 RepID=A0A1Z5HPH4_9FIRM|nr:cyclic lactone autoinducer peptide [Calderihabitans maritimus]GAW91432.1 hypothetical protein KKC1_05940 [Calderihabitans maritimus]
MKRVVLTLAAAVLTLLAFANVAAATGFWSYQPEVPDKLLK